MLNFIALEPREFAELSRDILQKIVKKRLYLADGPYDEGMDFTDSFQHPCIVGQAKRYMFTPVGQLMRQLEKEKAHIEKVRPEAYYLFISKNLTRKCQEKIISLFRPFTGFGFGHIFTLAEIDELLQKEEYRDVLEKYPKLWNFSIEILSKALYKHIDFDTREILLNIQSFSEFVPTESYCECMELLEREHAVLLQGAPGTGKTVISRRVALEFAQRGYRVHYTTDGKLCDMKAVLTQDDTPELILLDDFLGQLYVTMDPGRAGELETLLQFVRRSKNKWILLNSRITILQEAQRNIPLFSKILSTVKKIRVDDLSEYEKARILQNHLLKQCADRPEFYRYVASEKRYWDIIRHKNFNPRIIGMMDTDSCKGAKEFYERLMDSLNDPAAIWKQEFEQNLRSEDRILLTTLYSLTNTEIEYSVLEACYIARIKNMPEIDKTVDQIENVLNRLNRSMICQTLGTTRKISVLNPSVNDFLSQYIRRHRLEREAVPASAVYFEQIYKVFQENYFQDILESPELLGLIEQKFQDHSLLNLQFEEEGSLGNILLYLCIIRQPLMDDAYRDRLLELFRKRVLSLYHPFIIDSCLRCIVPLFSEPLFSYYQIERQLADNAFVEGMMQTARRSSELLQVLSLMWSVLSSPSPKYTYDVAFFKQKAAEYVENRMLSEIGNFEVFFCERYNRSQFDLLVQKIPEDMPVDEIIDYCEYELSTFLEDDLTNQFVEYVVCSIQETLETQPWFEGKTGVDQDVVLIDQNIWRKAEIMIDNTMYDLLPEEVYEEYTAQQRESRYNHFLERDSMEDRNNDREKLKVRICSLFEEKPFFQSF